jgi:uncharacterized membrane protein
MSVADLLSMKTNRVEAFSDGVLAIIITIMVLELHPPHTADFAGLRPLFGIFLSYILSFVFLGIYWNNHHHMLHVVTEVSGPVLWANLHLLFWLSLIPFATAWMGENCFAAAPVALYGIVLLGAACAWWILKQSLISKEGKDSTIAIAMGKDLKGKLSIVLYVAAIAAALFQPWISCALYVIVAAMWLVPDRRIERTLVETSRRV